MNIIVMTPAEALPKPFKQCKHCLAALANAAETPRVWAKVYPHAFAVVRVNATEVYLRAFCENEDNLMPFPLDKFVSLLAPFAENAGIAQELLGDSAAAMLEEF